MQFTPDFRPLQPAERLILIGALLLAWFLVWAHPLYPPDEGRFAAASALMAEGSSLLLPEVDGRPALTPPLTYWLQATAIRFFGRSEIAVRLPSLLAASAMLLVLFASTRRTLGTRPAVTAVALAAIMPFTLFFGRLATADALLMLSWVSMLACAKFSLATHAPLRWTIAGFWCACAIGILNSGLIALGPLFIVIAWQVLAGRPAALLRLRPLFGLPLALLPFITWLLAARASTETPFTLPDLFVRTVGDSFLSEEPFWFRPLIYLAGAYPATAFMVLPFLHVGWSSAMRTLRAGDPRALMLIALLLSLFGCALSSEWLPPIVSSSAYLGALTLERWMRGEFDRPIPGFRPPNVRVTLALTAILFFVGGLIAAFAIDDVAPELWPLLIPTAIVPMAAIGLVIVWKRGDMLRRQGLAVAWIGFAGGWTILFGIETRLLGPMSADRMLARLEDLFAFPKPPVIGIGFEDPTITFYNEGRTTFVMRAGDSIDALERTPKPAFVLMPRELMQEFTDEAPEVMRRLEPVGTWTRRPVRRTEIFLLRASVNSGDS